MEVYCRCKKCNKIMKVDYDNKLVKCPSCGEILLDNNDDRIDDNYQSILNGNINIIGDEIDSLLKNSDEEQNEDLLFKGLDLYNEVQDEELEKNIVSLEDAKINDLVKFGGLFWKVINIKDGLKLLLSKDCKRLDFDFEYGVALSLKYDSDNYKWETSIYRQYLNGYFYDKYFDDKDKKRIVEYKSTVLESNNIHEIGDKIFILSKNEVLEYLPSVDSRVATFNVMFNNVERPWLLRLDNNDIDRPDCVLEDGTFDVLPEGYVIETFRPAVWVK